MSYFSWLEFLNSDNTATRSQGRRLKKSGRRPDASYRPLLERLEDRVVFSTFSVTTPLDTVNSSDALLSLREAISAAKSGDQIKFDQGLKGSTINLDPAKGELLINKDLRIVGLGADKLAISGQNVDRVFEIAAGATDTISGLTIENGNAGSMYGGGILNNGSLAVRGSSLSGNSALYGGGIYNGGTLTVDGSTLSDNTALYYGAGLYNAGQSTVSLSTLSGNSAAHTGGAIYSSGTLTVNVSSLANNSARYQGGGISNYFGKATINLSALSHNFTTDSASASNAGGGIENFGTMTINASVLSGNSANIGGAIFNGGPLTLSLCSLTGNSATLYGGGIYNDNVLTINLSRLSGNSAAYGGGIFNYITGSVTVVGSALSGNSASYGGGVYNYEGTLTLSHSALSGNSASVSGGGIYNESGNVTVSNSSAIIGNVAPLDFGADVFNHLLFGGVMYLDGSSTIGVLDGNPVVLI